MFPKLTRRSRPSRPDTKRPRIVYFTPSDLQVPRVDRQCILRFCDALAQAGCNVEVVALRIRLRYDEPSVHMPLREVYGLHSPFPIRLLRSGLTQTSSNRVGSFVRLLRYTVAGARYAVAGRGGDEVVTFYFKNPALAVPFTALRALRRSRLRLVFELHAFPRSRFRRSLVRSADLIVSNHPHLTADLAAADPGSAHKLKTFHQGVDLAGLEEGRVTREEARDLLGLSKSDIHVVYTGKIAVGWRETELLADASRDFDDGIRLLLVGGRVDHVEALRERYATSRNVTFTGFIEPFKTFLYQLAADILVLYYTYDKPLLEYVSPGKLFEYMAARRPIICADHPSLRAFLDDTQAIFVPPENPRALASSINVLAADPTRQDNLANNSYRLASAYTWSTRAELLLAELAHMNQAPTQRSERLPEEIAR